MNQTEQDPDVAQIGRVLHFVIDKGHKLQCRPALVVEDWPEQGKPGYVNLVVFVDGSNDLKISHTHEYEAPTGMPLVIGGNSGMGPSAKAMTGACTEPATTIWETSVLPNHAVRAYRTWHWPKECQHLHTAEEPFVGADKKRYHHNHDVGVVDLHNCFGCATKNSSKEVVDAER